MRLVTSFHGGSLAHIRSFTKCAGTEAPRVFINMPRRASCWILAFREKGDDDEHDDDDTSRIGPGLCQALFQAYSRVAHPQGHRLQPRAISSVAVTSFVLFAFLLLLHNIRVCANVIHDAIIDHFEEMALCVRNNARA